MMISSNICVVFFIGVIIQVHSSVKTFRCNDGKYISNASFCPSSFIDQNNEHNRRLAKIAPGIIPPTLLENLGCEDESDKSYGCDSEKCGFGKFKCANGDCRGINVRCNTIKECSDGSDEINCGDQVNVKNCSLADGKFLCYDNLRCLDLEYTCDGDCNCFDCSDENHNCTVTVQDEELSQCSQSFPTPNGPKCFCDPDHPELDKLCEKVEPCKQMNACDQKCFQYKDKVTCSCYDNYSIDLSADLGILCRNKVHYENLLVYATSNQLKVVNFTSEDYIFIQKNVQIGAVVGAHEYLYYTTYDGSDRKTIYQTSISTGMSTGVIQSNSPIISIGVDYITNNIYFTTNTSLSVCSNDGKICTQLKCCNVRHVALAPQFGLMFYMKKAEFQDEKFIMKSSMDGSNEEYFVDGGFLHFSILAVDESTRKLYWMQQEQNEIWSLSYNDHGYKQLRMIKYHGALVGFAIFDGELLFTKSRDNEIYKLRNIEHYTSVLKPTINGEMYQYYNGIPFSIMNGEPVPFYPYDTHIFNPPFVVMKHERMDGSRIKRRILSSDDNFFHHMPGRLPLDSLALSTYNDYNATRIIDTNVTFAIKNVYAFNPLMQSFSQNPCSEAPCNGLCLLRPPSLNDFSNYVCISENLSPRHDQNLNTANNFVKRNDPTAHQYSIGKSEIERNSSGQSQRRVIILIAVLAIVALLLVVAMYLMLRKRSWSNYYTTLRNWRLSRSTDRVNFSDHVEL